MTKEATVIGVLKVEIAEKLVPKDPVKPINPFSTTCLKSIRKITP